MIVFGDRTRSENPAELIGRLQHLAKRLLAKQPCGAWSDVKLKLLISAGELAQGLLDGQFVALGSDESSELSEGCDQLCHAAAALASECISSARASSLLA